MLAALRRHPFPVSAYFRQSLVLTFAYPQDLLRPLLPPGLTLDVYDDLGFLAIALVQTEALRPSVLPAMFGRDFFLSGYRIFCRYELPDGRRVRGLRILRSDADSRMMVWSGNLLTHYHYHKCDVTSEMSAQSLAISITTPSAEADLDVRARLDVDVDTPPEGSPFPNLTIARRYAGPLPFTFDYEKQSDSMVIIEGVRENWHPRAVHIESVRSTFLERAPFNAAPMRLANAFLIENIPYRWKRGVVAPLREDQR